MSSDKPKPRPKPISIIQDRDDDDFANAALTALTMAHAEDFNNATDHDAGHIAVPLTVRKGLGNLHIELMTAEIDGRTCRLALSGNNVAMFVYIEDYDCVHFTIDNRDIFRAVLTIIDEHFKTLKTDELLDAAAKVHKEDQDDQGDAADREDEPQ